MMKKKTTDILGVCAGVFVLVALIASTVIGRMPKTAGVKDSDIPPEALTLSGTAQGRNGDVTVSIRATPEKIYKVSVTDHSETEGIGTLAVDEMPGRIYDAQSLNVDVVSSATITSEAILKAVANALDEGGIPISAFGGSVVKATSLAGQVQTGSGVTVIRAVEWENEYPEIYASWARNAENDEVVDYLTQYPMLPILYENYGFSYSYGSARGHFYDIDDILETGRPHALANCFTCKTPDFTAMVNEMGDAAYSLQFTDVQQQVNEPISCYNCHANTPGQVTVTHSYLIDAVGEDFNSIDAGDLACGQCHVEYYFDPTTKATTLPHTDIASMSPDAILAFYNDGANFPDGEPFADYTNPRTGVRQIKVQHPELETYLGDGSVHRGTFTCADCHMGDAVTADGTVYKSHYLTSPLENEKLIANECSACHTDLVSEVKAVQAQVESRTYSIGYSLEQVTELLASAVESGKYSEDELSEIRSLARDAQFYWDFVFVENSEGAHNPQLTNECLDKAEALAYEALILLLPERG